MSFRCNKFQIRLWIWLAFICLGGYFGFTILSDKTDLFVRCCIGIFTGCASLWWLWMMRTFDKLVTSPYHGEIAKFKDDRESGN